MVPLAEPNSENQNPQNQNPQNQNLLNQNRRNQNRRNPRNHEEPWNLCFSAVPLLTEGEVR